MMRFSTKEVKDMLYEYEEQVRNDRRKCIMYMLKRFLSELQIDRDGEEIIRSSYSVLAWKGIALEHEDKYHARYVLDSDGRDIAYFDPDNDEWVFNLDKGSIFIYAPLGEDSGTLKVFREEDEEEE